MVHRFWHEALALVGRGLVGLSFEGRDDDGARVAVVVVVQDGGLRVVCVVVVVCGSSGVHGVRAVVAGTV